MKEENNGLFQRLAGSLYWRISLIFLSLSTILTIAYFLITAQTADMYFQETSQQLNREIAAHIVDEIDPFLEDAINEEKLKEVFHNTMVLNPSIEIYLLDTTGKILSYFAPKSKVKLERVSTSPIKSFISDTEGSKLIQGDDPRNPGELKVISAAPIYEEELLQGYIYVVLAGEEYTSVTQFLINNYRLQLAGKTMIFTFLVSMALGLVMIWLLIRNLRKIMQTVRKFQEGDYSARINLKSRGELTQMADAFDEMADTIVRNFEEIKSVEELRRELIANVSHDLRTPLTAIGGYAETLVMKADSLSEEEKISYLKIILNSTEKISKMVEDLFQLSKLETRQIEPQIEPFSITELTYDLAAKYELRANTQKVTIIIQAEDQLPFVNADIALTERVLQNLLDNALKHTHERGAITIGLQLDQDKVKISVADTGNGIPAEELPHIFDRYRKGATGKDGSGLGLAIVKKILELHNSTIEVTSKPGKGSSFHFALEISR